MSLGSVVGYAGKDKGTSTMTARSSPPNCCARSARLPARALPNRPPAGGGEIERLFRTIRESFLAELGVPRSPPFDSLDALIARLQVITHDSHHYRG